MGVGTSLGAYYESDFHHEAGVQNGVIKPPDTGDDNIIPPDDTSKPTGTDEPIEVGSVVDKLLGTNGEPRYQTWPEKVLRNLIPDDVFQGVHNIMTGQTPMWALDQTTGEFHTSPEGIKEGVGLGLISTYGSAASADTATAGMPLTVHLRGEGVQALQEGPDAFQQFLRGRGARQQSNIEQYVQENPDWDTRLNGPHPRDLDQQPFDGPPAFDPHDQNDFHTTVESPASSLRESLIPPEMRGKIEAAKSSDTPVLFKNEDLSVGRRHLFNFADKNGVGDLSIIETEGGKHLHVGWIGTIQGNENSYGPQNFGYTGTKALLNQIKDEFPNAETIGGFRISGARSRVGKIGDAEMRIRPPRPEPQRKSIDELNSLYNSGPVINGQ